MDFSILHQSSDSKARTCQITTEHGTIETPVFMPVGTQGSVKTLSPDELEKTGTTIVLNNTYHLFLRPGPDIIKFAGGAHKFCGWSGSIVTDSGGYQVFSLADLRTITDEGVRFQSHLDGSSHFFTPESIIDIQRKIGADIIMPLDWPIPYPSEKIDAQSANRLTLKWARQSLNAFRNLPECHDYGQTLFGIVQGGIFHDLRKLAAEEMLDLDFPGYAIGGLSVGEPKELLYELTDLLTDLLTEDKPRYLMGVGKPENLIECIDMGIDMFDCVLPTRVGRNGWVYTKKGRLVIKNAEYKDDQEPIDESCNCYTCRTFSRAYIRHLFNVGELLGPRLTSLHNITFYQQIMSEARTSIARNMFTQWKNQFLHNYNIETVENIEE